METITPNGIVDYSQDWTDWLASGDSVSSSTWTVESGCSIANDTLATPIATAIIQNDDGLAGKTYKVINSIVTNNGLEISTVWFVKCQNRHV